MEKAELLKGMIMETKVYLRCERNTRPCLDKRLDFKYYNINTSVVLRECHSNAGRECNRRNQFWMPSFMPET